MRKANMLFFTCAFYAEVGTGDVKACLTNDKWCADFERKLNLQGICTTDGVFDAIMEELVGDWLDEEDQVYEALRHIRREGA